MVMVCWDCGNVLVVKDVKTPELQPVTAFCSCGTTYSVMTKRIEAKKK